MPSLPGSKSSARARSSGAKGIRSTTKRPGKTGRTVSRNITRWSANKDIALLCALAKECRRDKFRVSWDRVAKWIGPQVTGGAIEQHVAKLYTKLKDYRNATQPKRKKRKSSQEEDDVDGDYVDDEEVWNKGNEAFANIFYDKPDASSMALGQYDQEYDSDDVIGAGPDLRRHKQSVAIDDEDYEEDVDEGVHRPHLLMSTEFEGNTPEQSNKEVIEQEEYEVEDLNDFQGHGQGISRASSAHGNQLIEENVYSTGRRSSGSGEARKLLSPISFTNCGNMAPPELVHRQSGTPYTGQKKRVDSMGNRQQSTGLTPEMLNMGMSAPHQALLGSGYGSPRQHHQMYGANQNQQSQMMGNLDANGFQGQFNRNTITPAMLRMLQFQDPLMHNGQQVGLDRSDTVDRHTNSQNTRQEETHRSRSSVSGGPFMSGAKDANYSKLSSPTPDQQAMMQMQRELYSSMQSRGLNDGGKDRIRGRGTGQYMTSAHRPVATTDDDNPHFERASSSLSDDPGFHGRHPEIEDRGHELVDVKVEDDSLFGQYTYLNE